MNNSIQTSILKVRDICTIKGQTGKYAGLNGKTARIASIAIRAERNYNGRWEDALMHVVVLEETGEEGFLKPSELSLETSRMGMAA